MKNASHKHEDRGLDLYETPPEAVHALLKVEELPHFIWECAAGRGAIVKVLEQAGHTVHATDIYPYPGAVPCDFMAEDIYHYDPATGLSVPDDVECILTNPPFRWAHDFTRRALELAPRVIFLARLAFLESERRSDILDTGMLARVWVFRNRLPMMHRDGWTGNKNVSSMAFAWFVWDRDHHGPATIQRISWEPLPKS